MSLGYMATDHASTNQGFNLPTPEQYLVQSVVFVVSSTPLQLYFFSLDLHVPLIVIGPPPPSEHLLHSSPTTFQSVISTPEEFNSY